MYDVIVIGGGSSGLMASISAAKGGAKVLLVDKNPNLGKKLLLTGGGRCNVTNNKSIQELIAHIPGNGRFLYSCFDQFNNQDIMKFFNDCGVELKEEDHGRMFPTTNQSSTIVNTLISKCKELKVVIKLQTIVDSLLIKDGKVNGVRIKEEEIFAKNVIVCTGGKSFPKTGSSGDGYTFAKKAGHIISPIYPSESPLISNQPLKELQGISLRDIKLSVLNEKGKIKVSHQMDMIFTHNGISGPAALRCAMFVNQLLQKGNKEVRAVLDILPSISTQEFTKTLEMHREKNKDKTIKTVLRLFTVERMVIYILKEVGIDSDTKMKELTNQQIDCLVYKFKNFEMHIYKTAPIEISFVSAGGVSTKEINPKTFESKLVEGLYFAGEVVDVNGYTGGYNITYAFCSGYVAGMHASNNSK